MARRLPSDELDHLSCQRRLSRTVLPARALYAARLSRQIARRRRSPDRARWTIEPNRAPRQPIRTLGSTPRIVPLDPEPTGVDARLCSSRQARLASTPRQRHGRVVETAQDRAAADRKACGWTRSAYSAGGGAGEPASIGTPSGRRICSVLTTLREMNEGSGGPLARSSSIAAATVRSCSVAAAKSLW